MFRSASFSRLLGATAATALTLSLAACSSSATDAEGPDDNTAAVMAASGGDDTSCASIVLVDARLLTPTDAPSKIAITATIDVAKKIDVAKVGLKLSARAYNLADGNQYVSSGAPLSPQGAFVSLDATSFYAPDQMPDGWTKVGGAPSGFQRLTFQVSAAASSLKNEKFDIKDVDYNRLRFDVVPYAIDKAGTAFNDRNYNHGKFDSIEKEISYASISQLSAFRASDALYCCSSSAHSSCIHESYPPK